MPRTSAAAWLISSVVLAAAYKQPIARRDGYQYSNSTGVSTRVVQDSASSSSAGKSLFSYVPVTTGLAASPAPSPIVSSVASTAVSVSSLYHGPSAVIPGSRSFPPDPTRIAIASSYQPSFSSQYTTTSADNDTCGGATLNVLNATLDWWFETTLYDAVSTLSFQRAPNGTETGWTILGPTTTFDYLDSLTTFACDPDLITVTDTTYDTTYEEYNCSEASLTLAAVTTAVTLTGYQPVNTTTGTGFDVPPYQTVVPPASTSIPGTNVTFGTDSPFVYFSQYEIVSSNYTKEYGSQVCRSVTSTFNMSAPFGFSYTGPAPAQATDPYAQITGDVDPALPTVFGLPYLTPGAWYAVPTVIVVVEEVFEAQAVAYAATPYTVSALDVPSASLPPGISASSTPASNAAYDVYTSLTGGPRVETSDVYLLVPSVTSTVVAIVPQSIILAPTTSNTPASPAHTSLTPASSQPANALDVLSQALGSAILQGIGSTSTPAPAQVLTIAGATATISTVSAFVVDGQTIIPGGSSTTLANGETISAPSGGDSIVVDGTTTTVPQTTGTITVDGLQVARAQATVLIISGQTAYAGGASITASGTPVALASGGDSIVVGSSTSIITKDEVITIGTNTFTANAATQFVLGAGQTLTPGGTAIISGTTVSLASGATAIIINGHTTPLTAPTIAVSAAPVVTPKPALTIDGQVITPTGAGVYVISGQTLTPGGAITFSGLYGQETVSLDNSGTVAVDIVSGKSTTATLSPATPVIIIGGQTFTAQSGSGATYIIDGQTITAGGIRTITVGASTYIVSLSAIPTVVEIELLGPSGQVAATSYETLFVAGTATASPGSSSSSSSTGAGQTSATPYLGGATSLIIEVASAMVAGGALLCAVYL